MCFRKLTKNAASVYDGYKKKNPLMARKKLSVKDVVFRRNDPDTELFRLELAWDTSFMSSSLSFCSLPSLRRGKSAVCSADDPDRHRFPLSSETRRETFPRHT